jgi:hypothetical protein
VVCLVSRIILESDKLLEFGAGRANNLTGDGNKKLLFSIICPALNLSSIISIGCVSIHSPLNKI